MKIRKF